MTIRKYLHPLTFAALSAVTALIVGAAGCGGTEDGTGTEATCYDYTKFTGTTPTVSFKTDVLPIFQNSCGLATACHGDPAGPADRPYLGDKATPDIAKIFSANVGVASVEAPTLKIVDPSKPEASFLMHKMDGTLTCATVKCAASGCGVSMPQGSDVLPQDKRDTVRRWIAQGAKND
jgi:hypothetical protein